MSETKQNKFFQLPKRYIRNRYNRLQKLENAFNSFFRREASGGIILLLFTIVALAIANIPSLSDFQEIWTEPITLDLLGNHFEPNSQLIVNDPLMVIFFFVVGLEIKRELIVGELSSLQHAALPIIAAVGGMMVPAALYALINNNAGTEAIRGWGVPMATDIAFAIGILALFGNRVPIALKIFLTALAIVDDLGAIVVIALFYPSHNIHLIMLLAAGGVFILLLLLNRMRVFTPILYLLLGIPLWSFVLQSGVHATIAGVLLAITIPSRTHINQVRFFVRARHLLSEFRQAYSSNLKFIGNAKEQDCIQMLANEMERMSPLMLRLEHNLHPWAMYVIMPLFALANAGVKFSAEAIDGLFNTVSIGIFVGLLIGKPLGITLLSYLAVKLKIARLPRGTQWTQIISLGFLAGIGFTMSIFINSLAFGEKETVEIGKMSILITSTIAGVVGWIFINRTAPKADVSQSDNS